MEKRLELSDDSMPPRRICVPSNTDVHRRERLDSLVRALKYTGTVSLKR